MQDDSGLGPRSYVWLAIGGGFLPPAVQVSGQGNAHETT